MPWAICSTLLTAKIQSHQTGNNGAKTALAGWGGRIRTSVWRNQNPQEAFDMQGFPVSCCICVALGKECARCRLQSSLRSRRPHSFADDRSTLVTGPVPVRTGVVDHGPATDSCTATSKRWGAPSLSPGPAVLIVLIGN
jgi:hypothetical protein